MARQANASYEGNGQRRSLDIENALKRLSELQQEITELKESLSGKAPSDHNHDGRYYTESEMDSKLNGKANSSHTHDDRYYTESEMNSKLNGKANTSHTHDDRYYTESEMNNKLGSYLPLAGGTVSGNTILKKGFTVHSCAGTAGQSGYVGFCRIKISATYRNSPIKFTIAQRGYEGGEVTVLFNNANSNDPTIKAFMVSGHLCEVRILKAATSTWDLYIKKSEAHDQIDILDVNIPQYMKSGFSIEWVNYFHTNSPGGTVAYKVIETPYDGNRISLLSHSYYNNKEAAGMTLRIGNSSIGGWNGDTFWICVDSSNRLSVGIQTGGATNPTWYVK